MTKVAPELEKEENEEQHLGIEEQVQVFSREDVLGTEIQRSQFIIIRFIVGSAFMALSSVVLGIRGTTLKVSIVQEKHLREIVLKAMGHAISKAVAIAEIIKKRIPGLHQEAVVEEVGNKSKSEVPTKDDPDKENSSLKNTKETETKEEQSNSVNKDEKKPSTEKPDLVKEEVVDKELLQAFRFFDYNKFGYIKMDDLRCLLHDLGKFLSHRDIKELVQSALYESSSAR